MIKNRAGLPEMVLRFLLIMPIGLGVALVGYALGFWVDIFRDGWKATGR